MWVADMDFPAAPEIQEAILARAQQGIFGYSTIPEAWQEAYADWWKRRHHFLMEKEWLLFCTGVMPAISSMVRGLAGAGEKVLVQTPVYHMFFHSITDNGRQVLEIGYLFRRDCWHKGYATEAATACKQYAFETLGANEVCSIIRDTNTASQRVALRNGMTVKDSWTKHYRGVDMPHDRYVAVKAE